MKIKLLDTTKTHDIHTAELSRSLTFELLRIRETINHCTLYSLSHSPSLHISVVRCRFLLRSLRNSTQIPGFILSSHVIDRIDYTIPSHANEQASERARKRTKRPLYPVADYIMIRLLYRARRVHARSYIPEIATAYGATSRRDNF